MIPKWKDSAPTPEVFGAILEIDKGRFARCLEPSFKCRKPAIRAHSIQNSRVLDLLVRNGHVVGFERSVSLLGGPKIDFTMIGRNNATTFAGLCSYHDERIFRSIEKNKLDLKSDEQLFLLAYRAAYRELHATMEGATKVQLGYQERVSRGLDPKDTPSAAGMFAVTRMMASYDTYIYKAELDAAHARKKFRALIHDVIRFDVEQATLAACALFSVDNIRVRNDVLRIHLNVLPISQNETVVVFSYLEPDASKGRAFLERILASDGPHQKYELSRLILDSCENFVLSPDYFATWSAEKRETVRDYFSTTIFKSDLTYESPELYLF
jgi:hypothetical protein